MPKRKRISSPENDPILAWLRQHKTKFFPGLVWTTLVNDLLDKPLISNKNYSIILKTARLLKRLLTILDNNTTNITTIVGSKPFGFPETQLTIDGHGSIDSETQFIVKNVDHISYSAQKGTLLTRYRTNQPSASCYCNNPNETVYKHNLTSMDLISIYFNSEKFCVTVDKEKNPNRQMFNYLLVGITPMHYNDLYSSNFPLPILQKNSRINQKIHTHVFVYDLDKSVVPYLNSLQSNRRITSILAISCRRVCNLKSSYKIKETPRTLLKNQKVYYNVQKNNRNVNQMRRKNLSNLLQKTNILTKSFTTLNKLVTAFTPQFSRNHQNVGYYQFKFGLLGQKYKIPFYDTSMIILNIDFKSFKNYMIQLYPNRRWSIHLVKKDSADRDILHQRYVHTSYQNPLRLFI